MKQPEQSKEEIKNEVAVRWNFSNHKEAALDRPMIDECMEEYASQKCKALQEENELLSETVKNQHELIVSGEKRGYDKAQAEVERVKEELAFQGRINRQLADRIKVLEEALRELKNVCDPTFPEHQRAMKALTGSQSIKEVSKDGEKQEELWKEVFRQSASRMDFMQFLQKNFTITRKP